MILKKCPKCGHTLNLPTLSKSERDILLTLAYMVRNPDCKFVGLLETPIEELDETLRAQINRGLVEKRQDGFCVTTKGRKLAGL